MFSIHVLELPGKDLVSGLQTHLSVGYVKDFTYRLMESWIVARLRGF
jgi:hypothetical protein